MACNYAGVVSRAQQLAISFPVVLALGAGMRHTRRVLPTVELRKLLERRCNLVSLEGLAEETRVPTHLIQAALVGRPITPRNYAKLASVLGMPVPDSLQPKTRVIRRRRGS